MVDLDFKFTARLWKWTGGNWFFFSLPQDISDDIKAFTRHNKTGFGSVRVKVTIGETQWLTSLFPSKDLGLYILPTKKSVRKAEGLNVDDMVEIAISVMV